MGTGEVMVRTIAGRPPVPEVDLAPAIVGAGLTALTVLELDRNITWLRASGLAAQIDAVLSGDLLPEPPGPPVFVPGAEGGDVPQWTTAAQQLTDDQRAAAAVWQLATAGAAKLRDLAPDAHAIYGAGGWTRAPGWMRLKAAAAGTPYRVLAEPELSALGAAHLALPGPPAPVTVAELVAAPSPHY